MQFQNKLTFSDSVNQFSCILNLNKKNHNQTVNDGVAHSKNPRKCAYHVTFDLDLDLEHILDAGLLETIVCKFGRDPAIYLREEAICAKVYRRTDRQTDGRKDDGLRAIALAHSCNELKIKE